MPPGWSCGAEIKKPSKLPLLSKTLSSVRESCGRMRGSSRESVGRLRGTSRESRGSSLGSIKEKGRAKQSWERGAGGTSGAEECSRWDLRQQAAAGPASERGSDGLKGRGSGGGPRSGKERPTLSARLSTASAKLTPRATLEKGDSGASRWELGAGQPSTSERCWSLNDEQPKESDVTPAARACNRSEARGSERTTTPRGPSSGKDRWTKLTVPPALASGTSARSSWELGAGSSAEGCSRWSLGEGTAAPTSSAAHVQDGPIATLLLRPTQLFTMRANVWTATADGAGPRAKPPAHSSSPPHPIHPSLSLRTQSARASPLGAPQEVGRPCCPAPDVQPVRSRLLNRRRRLGAALDSAAATEEKTDLRG
jgi:hypothetical protein